MNIITYDLLSRINDSKKLDEIFLDSLYLDLWKYYILESKNLNYEINIGIRNFKIVFYIIANILQLRVNEEEFRIIIENYVKLLMADVRDGHNVDLYWCIDHVWYLCVGLSNRIDIKKYNDCVPFIQQRLIERFEIKENLKEKVSRKIYTRFMARC